MATKHAGHVSTTTALLDHDLVWGEIDGKKAVIGFAVTVEHCACASFSRTVDPAAKRHVTRTRTNNVQWSITDAKYCDRAIGVWYCQSKIIFSRG